MPIVPPIFISSDDLLIFPSVKDAEGFLEPESRDPDDRAYDSQGRLLLITAGGSWYGGKIDPNGGATVIRAAEEAPTHQEALRQAILRWLRAEDDPNMTGLNLPELIQKALAESERLEEESRQSMNRGGSLFIVFAAVFVLGLCVWLVYRIAMRSHAH